MHEFSLMRDLMAKIVDVAEINQAREVTRVEVWLGALCHVSGPHFTEHFEDAARGTLAQGAEVKIEVSEDIHHPRAADIRLVRVDVAA